MLAIVLKEFKSRMRGWRTPVVLTLYVGILAAIAYTQADSIANRSVYGGNNSPAAQGLEIFSTLAGFQLALLIFLSPALSAGAVAGERERQTFDLLLCTGLSAPSIVLGKYLASLAFILLLLWAALPVFSLAFLFGGVTPLAIALVLLLCFATATSITGLTILVSALFNRVQVATAIAYALVFFQTVGLGVFSGFSTFFSTSGSAPPLVAFVSPISAMVSLLSTEGSYYAELSSLPLPEFVYRALPWLAQVRLALWEINIVFDLTIAICCIVFASYAIRPTRRVPRLRR